MSNKTFVNLTLVTCLLMVLTIVTKLVVIVKLLPVFIVAGWIVILFVWAATTQAKPQPQEESEPTSE
jgi:hypothetical protein